MIRIVLAMLLGLFAAALGTLIGSVIAPDNAPRPVIAGWHP